MCQDKAQRAGHGPALVKRCNAGLAHPPFRRKRALQLTGQRLAGRVEIYGSRY
jgi:hypothetical protein